MLGIELESSRRVASTPNYWTICPAPGITSSFFKKYNIFINSFENAIQCMSLLQFYCCEEKSWPRQLLEKKALNWGLAYSFRGLVYDHYGGKHGNTESFTNWSIGSRQTCSHALCRMPWAFEASKSYGIIPLTRPHLLVLILSNSSTLW
jgi:hypothetical protein